MLEIGSVVAGKYRIERLLGAGGMGAVFVAVQEPLMRRVALKVLKKEAHKERFLREMRAVALLAHPNVVTVFDSGTGDDGALYLAMELLDGPTLREELSSRGRMPLERAIDVAAQIARGLAAAHEHKIAHFDLKPENVVLARSTGGTTAKILDFGIARLVDDDAAIEPGAARATEEGTALGTPGYMSPEQLRGIRDDVRSDLYALGVILFELLAGRAPFLGRTTAELAVQHLTERPPRLVEVSAANVPPELEQIVMELLQKDPALRPSSASAVADRLARITVSSAAMTATSTSAAPIITPTTVAQALKKPPRGAPPKGLLVAAAVAAVAVAAVVGGVVLVRGGRHAAHPGPQHVAVLPVVDFTNRPEVAAQHLPELLGDALSSSLAERASLRVTSPLVVQSALAGAGNDPLAAVRGLDVDYAVSSKLVPDSGRVRWQTSITRLADDTQVAGAPWLDDADALHLYARAAELAAGIGAVAVPLASSSSSRADLAEREEPAKKAKDAPRVAQKTAETNRADSGAGAAIAAPKVEAQKIEARADDESGAPGNKLGAAAGQGAKTNAGAALLDGRRQRALEPGNGAAHDTEHKPQEAPKEADAAAVSPESVAVTTTPPPPPPQMQTQPPADPLAEQMHARMAVMTAHERLIRGDLVGAAAAVDGHSGDAVAIVRALIAFARGDQKAVDDALAHADPARLTMRERTLASALRGGTAVENDADAEPLALWVNGVQQERAGKSGKAVLEKAHRLAPQLALPDR